jgi:hypothetical protein
MIIKAKLAFTAAAIAATAIVAGPALATTTVAYSFNTTNPTGNSAENGTYGNAIAFNTANKTSTLQMSVTAWQSNLATNAISSAYLGYYNGGLGVTGLGDQNGANGLHQIDNAGLYTDFLLLEFNQAVTLASIKTNSYGINGVTDNDAVWGDASAFVTSTWDSTAGFSNYFTNPAGFGNVADGASGVSRLTGATTASTKWLVGAAFTPLTNRNDGFKLSSVTVAEQVAAVPEPATWLTMILGFGLAGAALRRRRRAPAGAAFA